MHSIFTGRGGNKVRHNAKLSMGTNPISDFLIFHDEIFFLKTTYPMKQLFRYKEALVTKAKSIDVKTGEPGIHI